MITKMVKQDIIDAVYMAMDFCADWRGEDYVGYICEREQLDINSQEIENIVFEAQKDYEILFRR